MVTTATVTPFTPPKRKPGRPLGSSSKPKPPLVSTAIKPAAMRPDQAAAYLSVSTTTIRRLINRGELETRRIGTALVVLTRSLDAFLERGT
jgi:excisionase family DNA binding protein